ncbi:hypothetical protein AIOL_001344 [Candidatus Rhodobacter oscarellae]|uniref:Uncharacterized protein n=1 Tax=Candidatus Rhodobacter oscarellae TaxID=1675527 RepID=A0A0J9E131_9RHOB|nr:hypothetical protein AIOL_001344 [Candidatus Rhodobacter lobularis]
MSPEAKQRLNAFLKLLGGQTEEKTGNAANAEEPAGFEDLLEKASKSLNPEAGPPPATSGNRANGATETAAPLDSFTRIIEAFRKLKTTFGAPKDADNKETGEPEKKTDEISGPAEGGASVGTDLANEKVDIEGLNGKLRQALVSISDEYSDGFGVFTEDHIANVTEDNAYWENEGDGMKIRDGVKPSDAVKDMFANPDEYSFECASSVVALSLKAQLEVLGEDRFNEVYENGLVINGWEDSAISGAEVNRRAEPGETILGKETVNGDLAPFSFDRGDELIPGDIYYFDQAGDASSYYQGWNVIYLGETDDGKHRFWTMEGIEEVELVDEDGALTPKEDDSLLSGFYLGASRTDPNGGYFS